MIIDELFPDKGKLVVTATGKEFIERLGVETVREVIFTVLKGENIRTQTEPISRRRIVIASGALICLFVKGWSQSKDFTEKLSEKALEQMVRTPQSNKATFWPAMWLVGLTLKSIQNVLRSDTSMQKEYIQDFEKAIDEASQRCEQDFGNITASFGFYDNGKTTENIKTLTWKDLARLTTAIGAATLTIRGSEKSTYGKLFEHLIMGSVLSILGFEQVENSSSKKLEKVFWLSDSSALRECDATIRISPGKLARFDIGFIGKGNSEIMKDKLSRYTQEIEMNGTSHFSQTFVIVDKMPSTSRTIAAALKAGAEIVQMSMQFWAVDLARKLEEKLRYKSEILSIPEDEISGYMERKLKSLPIMNYVNSNIGKPLAVREEAQSYLIPDENNIDDEDDFDEE